MQSGTRGPISLTFPCRSAVCGDVRFTLYTGPRSESYTKAVSRAACNGTVRDKQLPA